MEIGNLPVPHLTTTFLAQFILQLLTHFGRRLDLLRYGA
jgi:hypothetical protein